jgi:formamidopyrimidine-DNA glycosylase
MAVVVVYRAIYFHLIQPLKYQGVDGLMWCIYWTKNPRRIIQVIELPEALSIAYQVNDVIFGKNISSVLSAHTPHKLAWYYGEPSKYSNLLMGKAIGQATGWGSMVEIKVEQTNILFGEGAAIRFHKREDPRPAKHQLLIEFDDQSAISISIQMYGGIGCFLEGELDNPYYKVAKIKPSPLSPRFDKSYFNYMISAKEVQKISLKALLATEQRIPGLGNGVLQDILFKAKLHPKKRVYSLTGIDKGILFNSIKNTLSAMVTQGGRDTELDLFGHPGHYKTLLCKNAVNKPCSVCGTIIKKEAYMGGSVYFCGKCQLL